MFTRLLLAVVAFTATAAFAADPALPDGKYLLAYQMSPASEVLAAVVELSTADGKQAAKVVSGGPEKAKLTAWRSEAGQLVADLEVGANKDQFVWKVTPTGDRAYGTRTSDANPSKLWRATLTPTDLTELTKETVTARVPQPAPLKELAGLRAKSLDLERQSRRERDADKRAELIAQAKKARAEELAAAPELLRQAVEAKDADPAVLYFAAPDLIASSPAATADEVKVWAAVATAAATAHGRMAERVILTGVAEAFAERGDFAAALGYAERAAKAGGPDADTFSTRSYHLAAVALAKLGKTAEADAARDVAERVERRLDAEYARTLRAGWPADTAPPPRRDPAADRVAVLELFTGAMCPPCVAADHAFDRLLATDPGLILLQYHQHIPLPDPLTNPDTHARWQWYKDKFPDDAVGVPTPVFNGKPAAGTGGGREAAEATFTDYRKRIEYLRGGKAEASVAAVVTRSDDTLTVTATVRGGVDKSTVRIVLAEDEVRYLGGNGVRLHHHVVRSMFGKPEGWPVKELTDGKATAGVNLAEVKKSLAEYVDKYHKEERAFSNPDRPFKFEHLKVVVLVQDDESGEILAAVQQGVAAK